MRSAPADAAQAIEPGRGSPNTLTRTSSARISRRRHFVHVYRQSDHEVLGAFAAPFLSQLCFDRVDDLLPPPANLRLILAFEHHAQQRLRAGVPHEEPAVSSEARLDIV